MCIKLYKYMCVCVLCYVMYVYMSKTPQKQTTVEFSPHALF